MPLSTLQSYAGSLEYLRCHYVMFKDSSQPLGVQPLIKPFLRVFKLSGQMQAGSLPMGRAMNVGYERSAAKRLCKELLLSFMVVWYVLS